MENRDDRKVSAELDQALIRGLTESRISRRGVLGLAGGAALSGLLAACGIGGSSSSSSSSGFNWASQKKTGVLNFANWPLYIDQNTVNGKTVYPSLEKFTKEFGIKVNYSEVIQGNHSFFGKIEPELKANKSTGYDLMVITDGTVLSSLIDFGWLIPLDHSLLPNFAKYASPAVSNPSYDPGNKYTVAWQSGFTGIAYNPELTGREITSIADLFDPAFAGKVGMLNASDTGNLMMIYQGVIPSKSTVADWKAAAKLLIEQKSKGIVRKYYQQDYISALTRGDLAISMAYSGDIFQANQSTSGLGSKLKFVIPKEGIVQWTDNMCIPAQAADPLSAITYMNYVYEPPIAAMLTEYINYITPVPASKSIIAASPGNSYLVDSPLIFPDSKVLSKAYYNVVKNQAQEQVWNSIFQPIFQA